MIEIILNRWDMVMALNLVPLLALELHFRAQDRKEPVSQISVAVLIAILTVFMGAGMFATTKSIWLPSA